MEFWCSGNSFNENSLKWNDLWDVYNLTETTIYTEVKLQKNLPKIWTASVLTTSSHYTQKTWILLFTLNSFPKEMYELLNVK